MGMMEDMLQRSETIFRTIGKDAGIIGKIRAYESQLEQIETCLDDERFRTYLDYLDPGHSDFSVKAHIARSNDVGRAVSLLSVMLKNQPDSSLPTGLSQDFVKDFTGYGVRVTAFRIGKVEFEGNIVYLVLRDWAESDGDLFSYCALGQNGLPVPRFLVPIESSDRYGNVIEDYTENDLYKLNEIKVDVDYNGWIGVYNQIREYKNGRDFIDVLQQAERVIREKHIENKPLHLHVVYDPKEVMVKRIGFFDNGHMVIDHSQFPGLFEQTRRWVSKHTLKL